MEAEAGPVVEAVAAERVGEPEEAQPERVQVPEPRLAPVLARHERAPPNRTAQLPETLAEPPVVARPVEHEAEPRE